MEHRQTAETIAIWILIGCAVVFLLAIVIVRLFLVRYRQITDNKLQAAQSEIRFRELLLEVQENERIRFGADLHDNIIGKLVILQLRNQLANKDEGLSESLSAIISEARRISHDLSPPMIEFTSVEQLIRNALLLLNNQFKIVTVFDTRTNREFEVRWKIHLLRIVQEVVTNSVKHSGATTLAIHLRISDKHFSLIISDNGKGFLTTTPSAGIGIANIGLRAREISAKHKFKSREQNGTAFILHHKIPGYE